jgi:pimeloyl-ACP methyl ester carboxylesterase
MLFKHGCADRSETKAWILHETVFSRRLIAMSGFVKRTIDVDGISTGYLTAGAGGPPLVLLHGVGTSAGEWAWVLPDLARDNLVYAPDLPGYDGSSDPPDYSPAFTARFVASFLDAVGVERDAVLVGSSFGGLAALHLALSEPERVAALVLADSAGLDQTMSPAFAALALPRGVEPLASWHRTPPGAAQRAFVRASLLFARPWQIPLRWLAGQYRLSRLASFPRTELAALRTAINPAGQREVFMERLPELRMPTLIVWGTEDRVFPVWQAKGAAAGLPNGSLELVPNCGHLPHVEQPERFASLLGEFVGGSR